jgi:hypothetical protein
MSFLEKKKKKTVVDDYSRYTWIILMKSKAETRQNVVNLIKIIKENNLIMMLKL